MKKLFLTMLVSMMALGAMAQSGKFTVQGRFDGREDSVAFFLVDPATNKTLHEEIHAVTGELLEMSYDLENAAMLYVADWNNGYKGHMSVPAIPGETVLFYREGTPNTRLAGSQFYLDYNDAELCIEQPMMDLMNFAGECGRKVQMGIPQEEVMKEYEEKYPVLCKSYLDALKGYVKANPDKDAAAALIATIAETNSESLIDDIEAAAALLTERARGSVAANLYKSVLASAKKEREEEARQDGMAGTPAPDFTLNDINGKPLALSSLRGKWVIIDFWGSWCKWCIKGIPEMKEYYAKYSGKLEILGVDCNDTVEKWKAAVDQYELPWLHVYWDKENGDNPIFLYGVRGFPTKVVVDPEGNIAKIIVGEDPAFYEYLDAVLQ